MNIKKLKRTFIISFISSLISLPVLSENMYIDDTLVVPLRSGESTEYRIVHKGISSGTKVKVLQQNQESGYSKILTPTGIEGYLPTRFLTAEPIARDKLEAANQAISNLKEENEKLKKAYSELSTEHESLSKNIQVTEQTLEKNALELSHIKTISADSINLDQRNQELRESNEQLRNQLELLQTDNNRLKEKTESNMMLVGGGLVLLGVILTLLIPLIKPSKKNDSWA